jgi:hypothetical protein
MMVSFVLGGALRAKPSQNTNEHEEGFNAGVRHSHSIVAGGLVVIS